MTSRRFLEAFKDKSHSDNSNLLQYCRQNSAISDNFVLKGKLDIYIRSKWFLQGLPHTYWTKLFYWHNLYLEGDDAINFDDLLKKTLTLIGAKKQIVDLARINHNNKRISDLVDKSSSNERVSSLSDIVLPLPESAFQCPVTSVGMLFSGIFTRKSDEKIDNLTDIMQSLALSVHTLWTNAKIGAQVYLQLPILVYQRTTDKILIVTIKKLHDPDFWQELINVYTPGRQAIFWRKTALPFKKISVLIGSIWIRSKKSVWVLISLGFKRC